MYRATRTICTAGAGIRGRGTITRWHSLGPGTIYLGDCRASLADALQADPRFRVIDLRGWVKYIYTWCSLARSGLSWKASVSWEFRWIFWWPPFRGNCRNSFERRMLDRFYFIWNFKACERFFLEGRNGLYSSCDRGTNVSFFLQ